MLKEMRQLHKKKSEPTLYLLNRYIKDDEKKQLWQVISQQSLLTVIMKKPF